MALANVALTNTFDEWRTRTNQIIYKQDELEGNVANLLIGITNNTTNALNYANTAFLSKAQGGTVSGNVVFSGIFANISSNLNVTGTNMNVSSLNMNVSSNVRFTGYVIDLL